MEATKKAGRPKLPENQLKKAMTFKFAPSLIKKMRRKTKGKNRNAIVEGVLEKHFSDEEQ